MDILSILNKPINIICIIAMSILVWLIIRDIRCWYWRINDRIDEQQKQTELLEKILNEIKSNNTKKSDN